MICFAAITPHSPLLVPSIGKDNISKAEKTRASIEHLKEEIYASKPDSIVVISSHAINHVDSFSINLHDEYRIDFSVFGDLTTQKTLKPDVETITQIQEKMNREEFPFTLDSSASLDYGTGVPLFFLTENMKDVSIIPVSYSGLSSKEHVQFGSHMKDVLVSSSKRIAVIASGDLSHCLSEDSPVGFRPEGAEYDALINEAVSNFSTSVLLSTSNELLEQAQACVHQQLLILFGVLEHKKVRTELLSYEAPFGVGYLVAQFHFPSV
jgi:MEMO1 family protein